MPDKLLLTVITPSRLREPQALGRLLDAFTEQARTTPTHWGPDERARNPFDQEEVLRTIAATRAGELAPGLARRKVPRFDAYLSLTENELHYVKVEFGAQLGAADVQRAFSLGSSLARSAAAEFGIVHPIWKLGERSQRYSASGIIRPMNFARCGPRALCARTWLGPQLRRLFSGDELTACGCSVRETPWGGLEVDLVEQPWAADFETLSARQSAVMSYLAPSGAFGDYKSSSECSAGARWTPITVGSASRRKR